MTGKHDPFALAENSFHGAGKTLEEAIADAWEHAKEKHAAAGIYRVVDIYIATENPIREYSVVIGSGG